MKTCFAICIPREGSWVVEALAAYAAAKQRAQEKVMTLSHEPTDHLMTAQEVADFYEVSIGAVLRACAKHHPEIVEDAKSECMAHILHCGAVPPDVQPVLIPIRAVVHLCLHLRDSLVAETLQHALLDVFLQAELTGLTTLIGGKPVREGCA